MELTVAEAKPCCTDNVLNHLFSVASPLAPQNLHMKIIIKYQLSKGFPGDMPANAGDLRDVGSSPGFERSPGGGNGHLVQYSCLDNPHGQRSLAGYSPWGHKESDTTEVT